MGAAIVQIAEWIWSGYELAKRGWFRCVVWHSFVTARLIFNSVRWREREREGVCLRLERWLKLKKLEIFGVWAQEYHVILRVVTEAFCLRVSLSFFPLRYAIIKFINILCLQQKGSSVWIDFFRFNIYRIVIFFDKYSSFELRVIWSIERFLYKYFLVLDKLFDRFHSYCYIYTFSLIASYTKCWHNIDIMLK